MERPFNAPALPVAEAIPGLKAALSSGSSAVLEAPPGAGKTTIVPLCLLDEPWLEKRRIIMLEPRRLAARAAASRMAELLGEEPGQTTGYRTRFDSLVGPATRIEVVTEGILTRLLQTDPALTGAGLVIFDEFHERSVHADLGLALALEAQSALRPDLRILVMSATLDGQAVSALLGGSPIIRSIGRAYPVEVRHAPFHRGASLTTETGPGFISRVAASVMAALKEGGGVLVFLPGAGEIRRVEAALRRQGLPDGIDLAPLYGELPKERQDLAIRPAAPGRNKVVLATSIAETSLTIEGIRVVVDAGLRRVPRFSPSTGMSSLETVMVTRDSAEQRRGRAGRLGPGICVRLWPEALEPSLREKASPEILEADLAPVALDLAVWGVKDPGELKWLDPPPAGALSQARELLKGLGALDHRGDATAHGKEMARLPLHPRLAHMAIMGASGGLGALACDLCALLSERDVLKPGQGGKDPDLRHRAEAMAGRAAPDSAMDRQALERTKAVSRQLRRLLGVKAGPCDAQEAGLLLAYAYPDRIGRRRSPGESRFLLSNGSGAILEGPWMRADEFIVAANLERGAKDARIFLAAPVSRQELEGAFADEITETEDVFWEQSQGCVSAVRRRMLRAITLDARRIESPDRSSVKKAMLAGVALSGLASLPWDKATEALRARAAFISRAGGLAGSPLPDLSDEGLTEKLESWLGPWLEGATRLEHLKRLDMKEILLSMLSWEQRRSLDELAPTHLIVPSGSRIAIDYSSGSPVLAVRLQEVFGLERAPTVAGGRAAVVVHLLSPAGRPVQVTEDLSGFWASGYQAVRKELRGRYPKHYWPEDPLKAEPTRGAKKKKQG